MLGRTRKFVKIQGKINSVIREVYLREDIQCHSPLCRKCISWEDILEDCMLLSDTVNHYAIPSHDVIQKYWDVLEVPEIQGLILLQTLGSKVLQTFGRSRYWRFRNISRDKTKGCAVFLNEICSETYCERLHSHSEEAWISSCVVRVAEYYQNHLENAIPIIIISEQVEMFKQLIPNNQIIVMSISTYLEQMWRNVKHALELYDSISAVSLLSNDNEASRVHSSYLPNDLLLNGVKTGKYFRGNLNVNIHISSEEAFISPSKAVSGGGEILIFGAVNRNRAIHGDDVVVELLPQSEWKSKCQNLIIESNKKNNAEDFKQQLQMPTGKVVGILDRRWRDYVVSLPDKDGDSVGSGPKVLAIPYDYRIPKIRIATKQAETLRSQRFVVRIDGWEKDSLYPNGHFVHALGETGLLETEIQTLLMEHNILTNDFSSTLLSELPTVGKDAPWNVDDIEVMNRRDLRKSHLIFSIDPKGCEDVDDTLSVRKLENGRLELGVHIADVTHFVQPHSATDLEAQSRSTSVYLPDRRYDMLPHVLSGILCSLLGNVDRYAVSVLWELDENYNVKSVWYGRTVIRSSYKLSYQDAEGIFLNQTPKELQQNIDELQNLSESDLYEKIFELKFAVRSLVQVSRALRNKRLASGALELNSTKLKFEIDKTLPSSVAGLKSEEELEMHKTVAECMIFANHWVAKRIVESFPQLAVLRRHPMPVQADLECLQKLASSRGFTFDVLSNKDLAQSLENSNDPQNPAVNQIFRILATRAMIEAVYFCAGSVSAEDYVHYGLGIDLYTHFTSPIRRYCDIMVHRLLLSSLNDTRNYKMKMSKTEELCNHMNERHRAAQHIERDVGELFQAFYFSDLATTNNATNKGCLADAMIYSVKSNGFLVFVPQYTVKGAVFLSNKEKKVAFVTDSAVQWVDGDLELSDNSLLVKTVDATQLYSVFDHITILIRVEKPKAHRPKIYVDLFDNKPYFSVEVDHTKRLPTNSELTIDSIRSIDEAVSEESTNSSEVIATDKKQSLYFLLKNFREMTLLPPLQS